MCPVTAASIMHAWRSCRVYVIYCTCNLTQHACCTAEAAVMKNLHSGSWRVEFQIVTYRPVICNLAYLCRTAISFSMLFSLPSKAFFGIHLMATNLWVLFSSARTTSENAPLKHKHGSVWQTICLQVFGRSFPHACRTLW